MQRVLVLGKLIGVNPQEFSTHVSSENGMTGIEYLIEPQNLQPKALIERLNRDPLITGLMCPLSQSVTAEVFSCGT